MITQQQKKFMIATEKGKQVTKTRWQFWHSGSRVQYVLAVVLVAELQIWGITCDSNRFWTQLRKVYDRKDKQKR